MRNYSYMFLHCFHLISKKKKKKKNGRITVSKKYHVAHEQSIQIERACWCCSDSRQRSRLFKYNFKKKKKKAACTVKSKQQLKNDLGIFVLNIYSTAGSVLSLCKCETEGLSFGMLVPHVLCCIQHAGDLLVVI